MNVALLSGLAEHWTERWHFLVVLGLIILGVYLAAQRYILAMMRRRLRRLQQVQHFDAVPTASPYERPLDLARVNASKNIKSRYSVIRSIVALCLAGVVALAVLFPMLSAIPQALVSFLVAIGIAVVGMAARPLVENLIAGAVLSFSNQLRIGDTVLLDNEHYGTVEDINATHTVLKLWDWRRYVVPNGTMLSKEIVNLSHKDQFLWAHVEFHVSGRAPLDLVEELAIRAAKSSKYFADYEAPQFWLRELAPGTIKCWLAAWAASPEDAWYLRVDIRRGIADSLRQHGIESQLENVHLSAKRRPPPDADLG